MSEFSALEYLWFVVASAALVLSLARVIRGPTVADRALAFDVLSSVCVGFFVLFARHYKANWLLDGVFILSFLSFLGTLAVAYYMEESQNA